MKIVLKKTRRGLCLLLAAILLMGCAPALGEASMPAWVNTDVEGAVQMLTKTRLKDDFHMAVNRQWLLFEPIPWGASQASSFVDLAGEVMYNKAMLMTDETLTGPDAELMRKLYALTLDWDTRNALGVEPIRAYVEDIASIRTLEELTDYMLTDRNVFMLDPSAYDVIPDVSHPDRYIAALAPVPLILDDSAEYQTRTAYGELLYGITRDSTALLLEKLGYTPEEAQAVYDRALAFDAMVAPYIKPASAHYEADYIASTLNYYDREGLAALCGPFPMPQILDLTATGKSDQFMVTEPAYFEALGRLYTEENVPLFRDWLLYFLVNYLGDYLDRDTYTALDKIESDYIGITGEPDDMDIALNMLETWLPVPMDNLYIQAYCTEEMRRDVLEIIDEVITHYRGMLEGEEWLSPATRARAVEKLDKMQINAVYPDVLGDWSDLSFRGKEEGGTLMEALIAINRFSIDRVCDRVNQPAGRTEWDQQTMPTSEVNATYSPNDNAITILAGILGGVFYSPDMTYEEKLGGIGMVIGHEISHAFDSEGAEFDAEGHRNNWWEEADYAAFRARADRLAAYYDSFVPYPGGTYSGRQVQSEAIADMGSMKCMLAIAKEKENFNYNAFFRQFSKVWRTKMLPNALIIAVTTDSHPLGCLRTNVTLQQFQEFFDTYEIGPGDKMYLAPEDRVAVW